MQIGVSTTTVERAAELTRQNKHGHVYEWGVCVGIDVDAEWLKSRAEVEELIEELRKAADELWPR